MICFGKDGRMFVSTHDSTWQVIEKGMNYSGITFLIIVMSIKFTHLIKKVCYVFFVLVTHGDEWFD